MLIETFYIDGRERTRRADIFAMATTDASFGIDMDTVLQHGDGTSGTMASTVAARDMVGQHDAVVCNPIRLTTTDSRLLLLSDASDGVRRADIGTTGAGSEAITLIEVHLGLHEASDIRRRTQDALWACADAELATRTELLHVAQTDGTGRQNGYCAVGHFLILQHGQSTVGGFVLRLHSSSCCHGTCNRQELATTACRLLGDPLVTV